MTMQTAQHILMVRPTNFMVNPQTVSSNHFQNTHLSIQNSQEKAQQEFDCYVNILQKIGVQVTVIEDQKTPITPDALFPNNWLMMLPTGQMVTCPMQAPNRRQERRQDILDLISRQFFVKKHIALEHYEEHQKFFEGTGSLIFDHEHKIAYACHASRSHVDVGSAFEQASGYQIIWFNALDEHNNPIYHTNVMMSIGKKFAIVCLDSVQEKQFLIDHFRRTNKTILDVSYAQLKEFTCNVLELQNSQKQPVYAMSTRAWHAFTPHQQQLQAYAQLTIVPLHTIETLGGGGARCMIAEIFLEKRKVSL